MNELIALIAFFLGCFFMFCFWYRMDYKVFAAVYHRGYRKGRADAPMKWIPTSSRPPKEPEGE